MVESFIDAVPYHTDSSQMVLYNSYTETTTILQYPLDTIANITDTMSFNCSASGIPLPDISWFKDNSPLDDPSANITESADGVTMKISVLTLSDLVLTDAGVYSCNASHIISGTVVRNFTFTIQSKGIPKTCSINFTNH